MSDRAEKLEQASRRSSPGPARCTLDQLRARWGRVTAPEVPRVGSEVVLEAMGGTERWRVTSIADGKVNLELLGGGT